MLDGLSWLCSFSLIVTAKRRRCIKKKSKNQNLIGSDNKNALIVINALIRSWFSASELQPREFRSFAQPLPPSPPFSIPKIHTMFTSHLQFLSIGRKCSFLSSLSLIFPHTHLHLHTAQYPSVAKVSRFSSTSTLCSLRRFRSLSCSDSLNHASHISSSHFGALVSESYLPCLPAETPDTSQTASNPKARRIFCCGRWRRLSCLTSSSSDARYPYSYSDFGQHWDRHCPRK